MINLNKKIYLTFIALIGIIFLMDCKKENSNGGTTPLWYGDLAVPVYPYNYENPNLPSFFNDQFIVVTDNTPTNNPITNWGATLGRVLFYDKRLSQNNTISCGSCHQQVVGFSDTARFSKGFNHGVTGRHSMGLVNSRYYASGKFFWDERANTLEEQVLMPIQDAVEMGMTIDSVVKRLKATNYYPELFNYAFGTTEIDSIKISRALAQFVRSMVSYQSPYDIGRAQVTRSFDTFPNFTNSENRGKAFFFKPAGVNCAGCHTTDVFIGDVARNNGIAVNTDKGVGDITGNSLDNFTFKFYCYV